MNKLFQQSIRTLCLIVAIGFFAVVLRAQEESPTWQPPPSVKEIDDVIREYVEKGRASGAVTLVAHEGKVVHLSGVGVRDIGANKPMHRWTRFAIASMSKPITATALMMLEDEGKLSLDDPIEKYLPEFRDVKLRDGEEPKRSPTLRDAVTHTSGIVGGQAFKGSLEDHVKEVASRQLGFHPGEKWQYGPGVSVAGRVVEVVSGQPFEDFLQERIFDPLRMKNTGFQPDKKGLQNLAVIYQPEANTKQLAEASNWISSFSEEDGPNPSGGLVSTALGTWAANAWQEEYIVAANALPIQIANVI